MYTPPCFTAIITLRQLPAYVNSLFVILISTAFAQWYNRYCVSRTPAGAVMNSWLNNLSCKTQMAIRHPRRVVNCSKLILRRNISSSAHKFILLIHDCMRMRRLAVSSAYTSPRQKAVIVIGDKVRLDFLNHVKTDAHYNQYAGAAEIKWHIEH